MPTLWRDRCFWLLCNIAQKDTYSIHLLAATKLGFRDNMPACTTPWPRPRVGPYYGSTYCRYLPVVPIYTFDNFRHVGGSSPGRRQHIYFMHGLDGRGYRGYSLWLWTGSHDSSFVWLKGGSSEFCACLTDRIDCWLPRSTSLSPTSTPSQSSNRGN